MMTQSFYITKLSIDVNHGEVMHDRHDLLVNFLPARADSCF
jgi:hypothetical protein